MALTPEEKAELKGEMTGMLDEWLGQAAEWMKGSQPDVPPPPKNDPPADPPKNDLPAPKRGGWFGNRD